jgi:hypothetical protein
MRCAFIYACILFMLWDCLSWLEYVCMQNYKQAALCYLSIFNYCVLFLLLKYEVAFIALNVVFFVLFFYVLCS